MNTATIRLFYTAVEKDSLIEFFSAAFSLRQLIFGLPNNSAWND